MSNHDYEVWEEEDERHWFWKYVAGSPGFVVGGLVGLVGMGLALAVRGVTNSLKTGLRTIVSVMNLALHSDNQFEDPGLGQDDKRHWFWKYAAGSPGLAVGGIIGLVGMGATFAFRGITNSLKTGQRTLVSLMNLVLHEDEQPRLRGLGEEDERHWFWKYVAGSPGFVVGGLMGLAGMGLALAVRGVTNSLKTGLRTIVSVMNLALHSDNQFEDPGLGQDDKRHWFWKYVAGSPGLAIGGLMGLAGIGIVFTVRSITNIIKTSVRTAVSMMNLALHSENQFKTSGLGQDDKRHWFWKYVAGSPGFAVGGLLGLAGIGLALAVRGITNSLKTGLRTAVSAMNLVLHPDNQFEDPGLGQDDKRHWFWKYIAGSPGLAIGGIIGLVGMSIVGVGRFVSQTGKSFLALSKSLLNGAVEKKLFAGVGQDKRSKKQKILGGLGYVAAGLIVTPIAVTIYAIRKIPIVLAAGVGIAASPLVGTVKFLTRAIKRCTGRTRFPASEFSTVTEQQFKNLYSSLNAWGQFNTGTQVIKNGSGKKGWGSFFRKCMSFNAKTVTEKTLDDLYKAFGAFSKSNTNDQFHDSQQFNECINTIKEYYANDCLASRKQREETNEIVDELAGFIKAYMRKGVNEDMSIPKDLYSKHQRPSWSAAILGE